MKVFYVIPLIYSLQLLNNMTSVFGFDDLPSDFLYLPDLEAIKEFCRNDSHPLSSRLVEAFENDCLYMPDPGVPPGRRKPFIVIEGNHRASRNVIGMKLARRLNGRYLTNLAPCLLDHFAQLPQGSLTRRVFYLLSIYATAFNAKVHLNLNRAVIINGYWWEQVTFSLLQALRGSPPLPVDHPVFTHPTDLLRPDLIVYVDQPKESSSLNYRSAELYRNLSSRYPIVIQTMHSNYRTVIDEVYYSVRENLTEIRDFRYKVVPNYDFR